jgi:hypothetical protein
MYVGRFDSGWRITVETVPRHLRHSVQSKLLTEALPNVKRWLIANHDTSGRTGGQSLVFRFDESYEELRSEENATLDWKTVRVEGELHD